MEDAFNNMTLMFMLYHDKAKYQEKTQKDNKKYITFTDYLKKIFN